ncbi:MAG: OmpA family protein, partial [Acidobacteria bacterium]|nr:OmpA family protein [Acidobacteriota bacterium]
RIDNRTLLVHFESDVLFDVDSATLDSSARGAVDDMAVVLNEYPKTAIVVQGYTDSTGSETHNLELSQHRAEAVQAHLVRRGVDPARLTAVGYGEGYPVADNGTESGRRLNRRVDVMIRAKAV